MRKPYLLGGFVLLILTFLGGYFWPHPSCPPPTRLFGTEIRETGYRLINPLLECELGASPEENDITRPLQLSITSLINSKLSSNQAQEIAYYFRDLNNGPWVGINEDANFTPASLLKTPMMMAYFKLAETDPDILTQTLVFTKNLQQEPNPSPSALKLGQAYSVEELISRMIVYSDNDAFHLLTLNIDYDFVAEIHRDLGLALPTPDTPQDFISVRDYAGLFRVLYNASYLNRQMSERALDILSQSDYRDGLVSGIKDDILVSHKYGIRHGEDGIEQLHDCGIVYYPNHPYLICVMTKGSDFATLAGLIRSLSQATYQELQALYPLPTTAANFR